MQLVPAESLLPVARRTLVQVQSQLNDLAVRGELEHVGGSSVPGALTRGDIDLHLRVAPAAFEAITRELKQAFAIVHPEIWSLTLATFEVYTKPPVGLAVTPAGSEHDLRFTRSWRLLAADPELVAEYNEMKRCAPDADYEARKSAFFDMVLARWPGHPAGGLHPDSA